MKKRISIFFVSLYIVFVMALLVKECSYSTSVEEILEEQKQSDMPIIIHPEQRKTYNEFKHQKDSLDSLNIHNSKKEEK